MPQTLSDSSVERNKQIARRFIEAIDQQDFATAETLLAPGFRLCFSGAELDRDQSVALIHSVYQSFGDFRHHIEETFAVDDVVILRITDRATHTGDFEGIAPTGRRICIGQISILRMKGEQIVEIREEADMYGLMQQLGAISGPPSS